MNFGASENIEHIYGNIYPWDPKAAFAIGSKFFLFGRNMFKPNSRKFGQIAHKYLIRDKFR